jgi:quercetin dioxygenase-like cupin family protein
MEALLDGWDMGSGSEAEWVSWGEGGAARAKVLGSGDGYVLALVEAPAGYTGSPHEHTSAEVLYVLSGRVRNQGRVMAAGDGYVAAAGSRHTDFEALEPATYVSVFRL